MNVAQIAVLFFAALACIFGSFAAYFALKASSQRLKSAQDLVKFLKGEK